MQFDTSLLVPTSRRTGQLVAAMPGTVLVAWLLTAALGMLLDIGIDRVSGSGAWLLLFHGIAQVFVQVWITRDALEHFGYRPYMLIAGALGLYLQSLLVGLGILLGLLLLILPAFYVAARWYLAGILLVLHGGGRRAAMQRSWDMLESHWVSALTLSLLLAIPTLLPLLTLIYPLPFVDNNGFAVLLGLNLVVATGVMGGYLAAVSLLSLIEPATEELQEIFG